MGLLLCKDIESSLRVIMARLQVISDPALLETVQELHSLTNNFQQGQVTIPDLERALLLTQKLMHYSDVLVMICKDLPFTLRELLAEAARNLSKHQE
jgi:hypothetical protein